MTMAIFLVKLAVVGGILVSAGDNLTSPAAEAAAAARSRRRQ